MSQIHLVYFASLIVFSSSVQSAITYEFESLLSSGSDSGSLITGTVVIDDFLAEANTYLSADTPATYGISGAIMSWEYHTPYGVFNSMSSTTQSHNVYNIDSASSPSVIMQDWVVDIQLDASFTKLFLGIFGIGDTTVELYSPAGELSSGVGEFTLATVPVPPAVWHFGTGLLSLIGVARKKINGN